MDRGSAISLTSPPLIKKGREDKGGRGQGEEYREKKGEKRDWKTKEVEGKEKEKKREEKGMGIEDMGSGLKKRAR
jgi:hypothetical protein